MRKHTGKIIAALCILLVTGTAFLYEKTYPVCKALSLFQTENNGSQKEQNALPLKSEIQIQNAEPIQSGPQTQSERQTVERTLFYGKTEKQNITQEEAEAYLKQFPVDDIFQDGTLELAGMVIEDMDGNGQKDLFVMLSSCEEKEAYGSGCAWFYMNEDEPYQLAEEECSYDGWFDFFAEDIDNDGNVEMVLSAEGSGCGGAGDFYKAIFKYKDYGTDHRIERMELPSDLWESYDDQGIIVAVYQEPEENLYSAYCSYFKEIIYFHAGNAFAPGDEPLWAGGNERGFYDLCPVKYQGKNALQASEYLYGEGGSAHEVATARFLILWDEEGNGYVEKWWVDGVGWGAGNCL